MHYSVGTTEGRVLQSTRLEEGGSGIPLAFVIGKGRRVPRGWEMALLGGRQDINICHDAFIHCWPLAAVCIWRQVSELHQCAVMDLWAFKRFVNPWSVEGVTSD